MLWGSAYPKKSAKILQRKRIGDVLDLLAGLALSEPATTTEIARFILKKDQKSPHILEPYGEAKKKGGVFFNLLRDRPRQNSYERYSGLLSEGYVIASYKVNEKKKEIPIYALTLKGCLFALGFTFNHKELELFIKNAARHHLFFAYLHDIVQKTSISFVTAIFLNPFFNTIKDEQIYLDNNIAFYFPNIAYLAAASLEIKINEIVKKWKEYDRRKDRLTPWEKFPDSKELVVLIDNTWYDVLTDGWIEKMIEYYYPMESEKNFFEKFPEEEMETALLYQVMRAIHIEYYSSMHGAVPKRHLRCMPKSINKQ